MQLKYKYKPGAGSILSIPEAVGLVFDKCYTSEGVVETCQAQCKMASLLIGRIIERLNEVEALGSDDVIAILGGYQFEVCE